MVDGCLGEVTQRWRDVSAQEKATSCLIDMFRRMLGVLKGIGLKGEDRLRPEKAKGCRTSRRERGNWLLYLLSQFTTMIHICLPGVTCYPQTCGAFHAHPYRAIRRRHDLLLKPRRTTCISNLRQNMPPGMPACSFSASFFLSLPRIARLHHPRCLLLVLLGRPREVRSGEVT